MGNLTQAEHREPSLPGWVEWGGRWKIHLFVHSFNIHNILSFAGSGRDPAKSEKKPSFLFSNACFERTFGLTAIDHPALTFKYERNMGSAVIFFLPVCGCQMSGSSGKWTHLTHQKAKWFSGEDSYVWTNLSLSEYTLLKEISGGSGQICLRAGLLCRMCQCFLRICFFHLQWERIQWKNRGTVLWGSAWI